MKTECDYLNGWMKGEKKNLYAKISPKMVNPKDIARNAKEEDPCLMHRLRGPVVLTPAWTAGGPGLDPCGLDLKIDILISTLPDA